MCIRGYRPTPYFLRPPSGGVVWCVCEIKFLEYWVSAVPFLRYNFPRVFGSVSSLVCAPVCSPSLVWCFLPILEMHVVGRLSICEIPFAEISASTLACVFSAFVLRLRSWLSTFYLLVFLPFLSLLSILLRFSFFLCFLTTNQQQAKRLFMRFSLRDFRAWVASCGILFRISGDGSHLV